MKKLVLLNVEVHCHVTIGDLRYTSGSRHVTRI
jgi:hypothetical protein